MIVMKIMAETRTSTHTSDLAVTSSSPPHIVDQNQAVELKTIFSRIHRDHYEALEGQEA